MLIGETLTGRKINFPYFSVVSAFTHQQAEQKYFRISSAKFVWTDLTNSQTTFLVDSLTRLGEKLF